MAELILLGVGDSDDVAAYVRALSLAFVTFALDHPGHFRLMFRNDLVNRNDPRYPKMSMKPGMRLGLAVAAYRGKSDVDLNRFEDPADILYVYVARARSSGAGRESCPFGTRLRESF